jgi:hypothetical protein
MLFALPSPYDLKLDSSFSTVHIQWKYSEDVHKGFKIFRDGRLIATVDKNTREYFDTNLTPDSLYKYTIKATDDERFFTGKIKAYIPALDFTKDNVYDAIEGSKKVVVSNSNDLKEKIKNLIPYTTIILEDNVYKDVNITFPLNVHHITIKAKNRHKAKIIPLGWDDYSAFYLPFCEDESECPHHINFIDLEIYGEGESINPIFRDDLYGKKGQTVKIEAFQFLKSSSAEKYDSSFIYFKGLKIHNLVQGIYSGVHTHDWTVDSCEMYNSLLSHMWYMLGWHHSVINSNFFNGSHDVLVVRGHYPKGEYYTYIKDGDTSCHGNIYVKDRVAKNLTGNLLSKDDWTHRIINNSFSSWDFSTPQRALWNTHIGIAYENYGDAICGNEQVYLPPQNIEISNNNFSNENEYKEAVIHAIQIDARKGINIKSSLESVNGIYIHHNNFIKANDNEEFITSDSNNTFNTQQYKDLVNNAEQLENIIK